MNQTSIYWFRRDLRLEDNRALFQCAQESKQILPIFIFDEHILKKLKQDDKRISYIFEALQDLRQQLKTIGGDLWIFYGKAEEIIPKLCESLKTEAVYTAKAHSAYGVKRDEHIRDWCFDNFIDFQNPEDTLIVEMDRVPQKKVFSAFYRCWEATPKQELVPAPQKILCPKFKQTPDIQKTLKEKEFLQTPSSWNIHEWKNTLKNFHWENYSETRDFPGREGTSKLSVPLRFGLISARQFFDTVKNLPFDTEQLEKEIAWKEFWYHILFHFPNTLTQEFQEKRQHIQWQHDRKLFQQWCEGKTGYPIVDAAMRQLNQEGWMHGRPRMIVASFLTKDLLIDWRWGERYFAEKLMDYDQAVNIGNWQWSASVGADPRPLRIFSPIRQSERFDAEATYIKKYIPELKDEDPKHIHDPLKYQLDYIPPIVDHSVQQRRAKEMYFKKI